MLRVTRSGADRVTWSDYEAELERNLEDLFSRLHRGAYRAMPSRRVYIPKPDGRQRPIAVAALEDKLVAIYEEDFLGFSYGSALGGERTMRSMPSQRSRRPSGQEIEDKPVVDLPQRGHLEVPSPK